MKLADAESWFVEDVWEEVFRRKPQYVGFLAYTNLRRLDIGIEATNGFTVLLGAGLSWNQSSLY